jgi:hypothetical protein
MVPETLTNRLVGYLVLKEKSNGWIQMQKIQSRKQELQPPQDTYHQFEK